MEEAEATENGIEAKALRRCDHSSDRSDPQFCERCQQHLCGARRKNCPACQHRFTAAEYEAVRCPECGFQRFCSQTHILQSGRCRVHGGKSLTGPQHPNWIAGRFARYWHRVGLGEEFEALSQSDLMDAMVGLSNLQARQLALFELEFPSHATLERIRTAYKAADNARVSRSDVKLQTKLFVELGAAITRGIEESDRWLEFVKLEEAMDRKRASIDRRAINAKLLVNADFVRALAVRLISANQTIIREWVREHAMPAHEADELIQRIGGEFNRAMSALALRGIEEENADE
jgi:hypothetical protein